MKIDSHQHFWSINRKNDYGFLTPDSGILYRDYLPKDLEPDLRTLGVEYTIVVQAAQTIAETKWLLEQVANVNFVAGVVGWLDFDTDQETFLKNFDSLKADNKFIGLRPMIQEIRDDQWILKKNVIENLKILESEGFPFDILIYSKHLPYVCEMLEQVPKLHAVIDHIGKPNIKDQEMEEWSKWMKKISENPNIYCKLSGMVTEADHQHWQKKDFIPYIEQVIRLFGQGRVMFGSDWPVCLQAAGYRDVYHLLAEILEDLDVEYDNKKIFGVNAAKFYKLKHLEN